MASLKLEGLAKSYGSVEVLRGIDLEIADGEFCVFVGPSGCGKSTLLRMIAGLEEISAGTLRIGGKVVNGLSPKARGIAMVFQSYALYPHRTVRGNMEFGLRLSRMPRDEINARVTRAARMLQIESLLDRRPSQLSGGQRQRVAIGRAIVREPEVFLFDEPLSNLDAALRLQTRREIADLHRKLGATMIYVTHDQVEAMTLADRIVVLDGGVIQQVGTPQELHDAPANLFVARFIGAPPMNVLPATAAGRQLQVEGLGMLEMPSRVDPGHATGALSVGIRPAAIEVGGGGPGRAEVVGVEYLGDECLVDLSVGSHQLTAKAPATLGVARGDSVAFGVSGDALHLFDPAGDAL